MSRIRANTITNQNANGAPNFPDGITVTGVVTATTTSQNITGDLTVSGNVGVGGTLTYEDVTNIDSIGIITARSSININAASSGIGITISSGGINVAGIVTATSYRGDGSQLSGISVDPSAAASSSGFLKVLNASTPQIRISNNASDNDDQQRSFFAIATGSNNFIQGSTANDTVLRARAGGDLVIGVGSTIRMRIDELGRVTKPNTPMFQARNSGGNMSIGQGTIPFGTVINNIGGHYNNSTHRFTAPVAGVYYFYIGWYVVSHSNHRVALQINGSEFTTPYISGYNTGQGSNVVNQSSSQFLLLSANDYVNAWTDGTFTPYGTHLGWGGCLLH